MNELLISIIVGLTSVLTLMFGYWLKSRMVQNGIPEPIAEIVREEVQEVSNDLVGGIASNTPKKKSRPKKSIASIVLLFLLFNLSSCSFISSVFTNELDKIHISYDNKYNSSKPIDSLLIVSKPTYIEFNSANIEEGIDYTFNKSNGSFWLLRVGGKFRLEFTPKDTIIKIYKAK